MAERWWPKGRKLIEGYFGQSFGGGWPNRSSLVQNPWSRVTTSSICLLFAVYLNRMGFETFDLFHFIHSEGVQYTVDDRYERPHVDGII